MKILIYDWNFFTKRDLYRSIKNQGIEIELFYSNFSPRIGAEKEQFTEQLSCFLKDKSYDAFFSINFFPEFAEKANEIGIPYICWTYDSPSLGVVTKQLRFDTNWIFVFDSSEYEMYKGYGLPHLYYLPLGVDNERLGSITVPPMAKMKFYSEVSFVGQLYQSDMDKILPLFDEYGAGYIAAIINTQLGVYGTNIIKELINEKIVERFCNEDVKQALMKNLNGGFFYDVEKIGVSNTTGFLLKAVTNRERVILLSLLAKHHKVKLYTKGNYQIPGVTNMGLVDYVKEMPLVFKCSKINLNITLRTIEAGVPQRVLDIMACKALALTNYQKDMEEYFIDEENILIYHSMEEAADKCNFYLKHEDKAEKIRQKGYHLIKDYFNMGKQLGKIWETCGLKDKI